MEQFPPTALWGIAARGMWRAAAIGFASYADGCTQMVRLMSGARRAQRDPAASTSAPASALSTAAAKAVAVNNPATQRVDISAVSVPRAKSGEALEPTRSATGPTVRQPGVAKQSASRSGPQRHGKKKKDRTQATESRSKIEGDDLDSAPLK